MKALDIALKKEEEAVFLLRSLYEKYGYAQFKMNKFEEYDLYVRNKDFLISDSIITFTDTNGKLLALKPDVTLSIIKNSSAESDRVDKFYYDENVYRVSGGTNSFKELMQVGVECMGKIDDYCLYEVLALAARSLRILSKDAILDISNFGIVLDLIDSFGVSESAKLSILAAMGEKNAHEIAVICKNEAISQKNTDLLIALVQTYGKPAVVLPKIRSILSDSVCLESLYRLEAICQKLMENGFEDMIRIDFSVVSGPTYYSGIVFKGFIKGVSTRILSGGQYDRLMKKMHRNGGAIGFAVYLDLLEEISEEQNDFDVDAVLLYDGSVLFSEVDLVMEKMISKGKKVIAQRAVPEKMRYRELWKISESGVELLERNA
jgi:ATP phosphoribosyltransferase regulatory subunit